MAKPIVWLERHGLRVQMVGLFVGLLMAVQAGSLLLVSWRIEAGARESTRKELRSGQRLFERLLGNQAEHLAEAAGLLAADFGLRAAVASADEATLVSALINHGGRVGADFVLYADVDMKLKASTVPDGQRFLARLRKSGASAQGQKLLVLAGGRVHQLVAAPVKAPLLIGWVVMGFEVKQALLGEVKGVAATELALLVQKGAGRPQVVHATLPVAGWEPLTAAWAGSRHDAVLDIDARSQEHGDRYLTESHALVDDGEQRASLLLLRSLEEATEPYRRIQDVLMLVTALAAAIFLVGSVLTARRIVTPLLRLAQLARRLGSGDYAEAVERRGGGELRDLCDSFESMRLTIRQRDGALSRIAYEDGLTGLPNRAAFRDAVAAAVAAGGRFGLLMLNLDRFKHVNNVLGHPVGDQLLREVATRLQQLGGDDDLVARLGGDEFALLVRGAGEAATLALAQRIHAAFETPLVLGSQAIDMSAGMGLMLYPDHADDADLLLARLDQAMRSSKRLRVPVAVYEASADNTSQESLSLLGELRHAVLDNQLELWLQPKVAFGTGQVVGAEALVRWRHPERGQILPGDFIPFAEQTGFIRELTHWVIEQGTSALRVLQANGQDLRLSINLSVRDLLDQDLPRKLQGLAGLHTATPVTLCLEITESAIMDDPQRALQTLESLHAMGFKLSIDDFGTGYSSLAYLKRLPVDELKIDKSFVLNMERDLDDAKIVRSVIDLGHNLGLKVVAEGIETVKTWKLLQALGCDEGQGYLIARPMPQAEFVAWVERWSAPRTDNVRLETAFGTLF